MLKVHLKKYLTVLLPLFLFSGILIAQPPQPQNAGKVRPMTIPISIYTNRELREKNAEDFLEAGDITVSENGDRQTILSVRSVSNTPMSLAVLIQDNLSSFNLEINGLREFIRRLPRGSRVMVGYLGNSLQVRQKFTDDLQKASEAVHVVSAGSPSPGNPYDGVLQALKRFDALPAGRRAVLLVSDGLDISRGFQDSAPSQSVDLQRAVDNAQKKGVAVYSFFSTTDITDGNRPLLNLNGQSSLERISNETGGRAFFQGTSSPVSFAPFLTDLSLLLNRQFALTYLSTHMKKGYYKIQVISTNPEVKIDHPKGYFYNKR